MKRVGRLEYLDSLRGIAALAVVIAHYIEEIQTHNGFSGWEQSAANTLIFLFNPGKFGVVLFFLISGYIIPNSLGATGDRIGRFCVTRFFRLYPLYWVALFLVIVLERVTATSQILANTTMIQGFLGQHDLIESSWTLQIELTFYGLCVLFAARHRMNSPNACAWGFVCALGLAFVVATVRFWMTKKLPVALPLAISLMFFGTLWRQASLMGMPDAKRFVRFFVPTLVVAIPAISLLAYNHDFGYHESWKDYTVSYLAAVGVFLLCTTQVQINWRPIVWLGTVSYSIYLLHPVIADLTRAFHVAALDLSVDPLIYVLIETAAVLPIAWLTYTFVEQPFHRLGHRLVGRPTPAAPATV